MLDGRVAVNVLDGRVVANVLDGRVVANVLDGRVAANVLDGRVAVNVLDGRVAVNVLDGRVAVNVLDGRVAANDNILATFNVMTFPCADFQIINVNVDMVFRPFLNRFYNLRFVCIFVIPFRRNVLVNP